MYSSNTKKGTREMNKKQEVYIGLNSQFSKTTGFSNTYIAQEVKELTDEEINEEIEITFGKIIDPEALQDEIDLARRILKKASEK